MDKDLFNLNMTPDGDENSATEQVQSEVAFPKIRTPKEVAEKELFYTPLAHQIKMDIIEPVESPSSALSVSTNIEENANIEPQIDAPVLPSDYERSYKRVFSKLISKSAPTFEEFTPQKDKSVDDDLSNSSSDDEQVTTQRVISSARTFDFDKIAVREYDATINHQEKKKFYYRNKQILASFAIITLFALIEIAAFYFIIRPIVSLPWVYFLCLAFLSILPLGYAIFKYSLHSNFLTKKRISLATHLFNGILFLLIASAVLLSIALLNSVSFINPAEYLPKVVIFVILCANVPICSGIYYFFYKNKKFFYGI